MANLTVEIADGEAQVTPVTPDDNQMLLIGKSTVIPSTNPFLAGDMTAFDSAGVPSSSALYKAAEDFFEVSAGTNFKLWAYAVSTGTQTVNDVTLAGPRNSNNRTFYAPYSPVTSITGIEVYKNGSGWTTLPGDWYTTGVYEGSPDGTVTLTSGGYYSGASGLVTGWDIGPADYVRADVGIGPLGLASKDLSRDDIYFQGFTFAYDQSKEADSDELHSEKYNAANTYGGNSWLDDMMKGGQMASSFVNIGKDAIFVASTPDQVKPTTVMTGEVSGYASGTSYDGERFGKIKDIIGARDRFAMFCAKQPYDGIETSAGAMGDMARCFPRRSMSSFTAGPGWSTASLPPTDEILSWESAGVNSLYKSYGITQWHGGKTFGVGYEGQINYVRVRSLLKKEIMETLQTLLLNGIKYTYSDILKVKSALLDIQERYVNLGLIDKVDSVEIPILEYLKKEDELNSTQQTYLLNMRQKGLLENIAFYFGFKGDVLKIVVSAVIGR